MISQKLVKTLTRKNARAFLAILALSSGFHGSLQATEIGLPSDSIITLESNDIAVGTHTKSDIENETNQYHDTKIEILQVGFYVGNLNPLILIDDYKHKTISLKISNDQGTSEIIKCNLTAFKPSKEIQDDACYKSTQILHIGDCSQNALDYQGTTIKLDVK